MLFPLVIGRINKTYWIVKATKYRAHGTLFWKGKMGQGRDKRYSSY